MDQRTRRWPDRQHTESRHCIAVFVLALLFAVTWNVWGQGSSASIVGTVIDPSGAVVPGFTIVVKNQATGLENSVTTDESGNYLITPLPAGQYSLKGTGSGFKGVTLDNISLAIGDRLRQDMKLEVGAVGESIEVTAQTAALQTDTSSLGSLIEQRAVQDLPVNGRNFVVLAQLAAGANEGESNSLASGARPDDRRQTSAISVNAQPSSYNNFLIDGMDDNERTIGTISVKPSMDALVEMRVQTNLYSAEFGRTAGGLVNFITKSGTNDFHGSLFEFLRNEKMDARNVFAAGAKPSYKQNQFGGSIGGPIRKNSTFFFGDYEGTRLRQGQTYTSLIPTMDQRRGIFTTTVVDPLTRTPFPNNTIPKSAMDQVGYNLVQLYPQPNASNPGYNFVASPMKTQDNDAFDSRADHRLANSDSVFARFSYNKTRTYLPGTLPVDTATGIQAVGDPGTFPGLAKQRAMAAQLNYVHLLGQALVLELRSGFNRYENAALPPNYGTSADDKIGLPGVNLDEASSGLSWVAVSGYRGLGDPNFLPIQETHNTFQNMASVTWMRGAHGLKFGADIRRRQIVLYQSNQPKGSFSFDGNLAGEPVASLLMGYPASTTVSRLLVWPGWRLWESAAYFQDDWRVNRWLTLNLGVRWDYLGPITEVANRISNVDPWSRSNLDCRAERSFRQRRCSGQLQGLLATLRVRRDVSQRYRSSGWIRHQLRPAVPRRTVQQPESTVRQPLYRGCNRYGPGEPPYRRTSSDCPNGSLESQGEPQCRSPGCGNALCPAVQRDLAARAAERFRTDRWLRVRTRETAIQVQRQLEHQSTGPGKHDSLDPVAPAVCESLPERRKHQHVRTLVQHKLPRATEHDRATPLQRV